MTQLDNISTDQIHRLFTLLNYSAMSRQEKISWVRLLPSMREDQLEKLLEILDLEAKKMTDLALAVLEKKLLN